MIQIKLSQTLGVWLGLMVSAVMTPAFGIDLPPLPPVANTNVPAAAPVPPQAPATPALIDDAALMPALTSQADAYSSPESGAPSFDTFGTPQDPAFENMTKKMYPLTEEQIQALKEMQLNRERAVAAPAEPPPKAIVSSATVSLAPGSTPPVIRLATGYVSSIVFLDETGAPWPIASYSIGDAKKFNIVWDNTSNLLMIQGQGPYAVGNMALTLRDLPTPVMLTLVNDQPVVDYRLDLRVQGRGPQANPSIIGSSFPKNTNVVLMNLLEGVAPQSAQKLQVTGGSAEAWLQDDMMYVRTPLTLLSPAWLSTLSSADGTHVYQMMPTPMVLASDHGMSVALQVKGL